MGKTCVPCLIVDASKGPVPRSNLSISSFSVASISLEESLLAGRHLVVSITISFNGKTIPTPALVDCGATGIVFIDKDFVSHNEIPISHLKTRRQIDVLDGRPISFGDITDIACLAATIQDHPEMLPLFVTKLQYPIVLGIPWLAMDDVSVRFGSYTLQFDSKYCKNHCNLRKSPLPVPALMAPPASRSLVLID